MKKKKLNEKTKNEIKEKGKVFRVLGIIKNVVCWTLVSVLAVVVVFALYSRINGNAPSLFGYSILRISSGSMSPELNVGDVILSKNTDDPAEVKVDDVITYKGESGEIDGRHVTHKVIAAPHDDGSGKIVLQTKGIANEIADAEISFDQVESIMVCKLSFIDTLYNMFLSPWGLIIFILLILLIFFDEIVNVVKIISGNSEYDEPEDINEIIDRIQSELKEKQIAELTEKKRLAESENLISDSESNHKNLDDGSTEGISFTASDIEAEISCKTTAMNETKGGRHRKEE